MKDKYGNEHSSENGQFVSQGGAGKSNDSENENPKEKLNQALNKRQGYYKISKVSDITNENIKKALGDKLKTNRVGISPERIDHIEDNHPGEYKKYSPYISEIINNPEAIIGTKDANRVMFVKKVDRRVTLILKMQVNTNLIITLHSSNAHYVDTQRNKYGELYSK